MQREPIFNIKEPLPVIFCGVFAVIFVLGLVNPGFDEYTYKNFALGARNGDPFGFPRDLGNYTPLVLHMLLHGDVIHLVMNTLFIFAFGTAIIRASETSSKGRMIFVLLMLFGGLVGGLAQWGEWMLAGSSGAAVGASSGASALFAAAAWAMGGKDILLKWGVGYLLINAIFMVMGPIANIAWAAHIGGYAAGAVLAPFLLRPFSIRSIW